MESLKDKIDPDKVPQHIAIIMDGNRRWAKERGEDTFAGHQQGVVSVRKTIKESSDLGVKYLTLYTFSTENWSRSQDEVDFLMELLVDTIEKETPSLLDENVRILAIGDLEKLPERTRDKFYKCMEITSKNNGLNLVIALNYSSRWEIVNAAKKMAEDMDKKQITIEKINEKNFSDYLTTKDIPNPELLIRTSGELRLSNFMLWQLAYAELYFTNVYWPDFREKHLHEAICEYQQRERRFGK
ncbi:MAG: isoprenyl transferase [Paludibacteraceae bacterium]